MASEQITSTRKPPNDADLLKWKPRKLKEYITNHGMDPSKLTGIDKTRLQFYAMDCDTWTKDRLLTLQTRFRAMFLEKIPTTIDTETRGIFMDSTDTTQRAQIVDKLLTLLPQRDPVSAPIEANPNEMERSLVVNQSASGDNEDDANDDMSSVSTHDSMPSLMSDDDSDDEDEESDSDSEDDANNQALNPFNAEEKSVKSIEAPKPQRNKNQTKKTKGKDDFLSGLQGAFLSKGKKGKKKDKKKDKKKPKPKPKAKAKKKDTKPKPATSGAGGASSAIEKAFEELENAQKQPKKATKPAKSKSPSKSPNPEAIKSAKNVKKADANKIEKKSNENKPERKVDTKPKIQKKPGYYLKPNELEAYKTANGNMFLCIGPRKLKADLTVYQYLKCWVSLKHKLKKRGKKPALYFAVLIDLTKCDDRESVRQTLKRPYENVISFNLNPSYHVTQVTKQDEKRLNLQKAFAEYQENGVRVNSVKPKPQIAPEIKKEPIIQPPTTNKPDILQKKVNVEQQFAKDQMADIQSKLSALSVHNNKKKEEKTDKNKTEKKKKKEKEDAIDAAYAYITVELMNQCRIETALLHSLMDDESCDGCIKGLYIRAPITGSQHRVLQIERTKHHNTHHYFMCTYGSTKCNVKDSKVSDEEFTEPEMNAWIRRMCKDGVALPNQEILIETAENLTTIREAVALKQKQTSEPGSSAPGTTTAAAFTQPLSPPAHQVQSPGAAPAVTATAPTSHILCNTFQHQSALNYQNLAQLNRQPMNQRNFFLTKYTQAIESGANCFWCIPTAEGDSNYIAFLLIKTSRNDGHLESAKQIAMGIRPDIMVTEIREWTAREDQKSGHWKSKGWFIDCKEKKSAYQITQKLQEFLPQTYGNGTPANFCRRVLKEFGDAYVKPRKKAPKGKKNKPMGPKYNYKDGEPSIVSMSECPNKVTFRPGEADYASMNDDLQSVSSLSSMTSVRTAMTNQTVSKYDQYSHMVFPQRPSANATQFRVDDKVQYLGKVYDVVWVDGESIRIENDAESELVRPHEISHAF